MRHRRAELIEREEEPAVVPVGVVVVVAVSCAVPKQLPPSEEVATRSRPKVRAEVLASRVRGEAGSGQRSKLELVEGGATPEFGLTSPIPLVVHFRKVDRIRGVETRWERNPWKCLSMRTRGRDERQGNQHSFLHLLFKRSFFLHVSLNGTLNCSQSEIWQIDASA